MAKLNAADPWATEPARKPTPKAGRKVRAAVEPEPDDGPAYNLRLLLDQRTLARLRRAAKAEERPLRVMALRLVRAGLDAIEAEQLAVLDDAHLAAQLAAIDDAPLDDAIEGVGTTSAAADL